MGLIDKRKLQRSQDNRKLKSLASFQSNRSSLVLWRSVTCFGLACLLMWNHNQYACCDWMDINPHHTWYSYAPRIAVAVAYWMFPLRKCCLLLVRLFWRDSTLLLGCSSLRGASAAGCSYHVCENRSYHFVSFLNWKLGAVALHSKNTVYFLNPDPCS
jgi:hypothetical protein